MNILLDGFFFLLATDDCELLLLLLREELRACLVPVFEKYF